MNPVYKNYNATMAMTSPTSSGAGQMMLGNGHHGMNVMLKNSHAAAAHHHHHMDQLSSSDTTSNSGGNPPPLYHTLYNNFASWTSNTGSAASTLPLGSTIGGKVAAGGDARSEDLLLMDSVSFYNDQVGDNSPAWPPPRQQGSISMAHQPAAAAAAAGQYLGALTDANGTVVHHVMSSNALILPSSAAVASSNSHVSTLSCLEPSTYLGNSLSLADPTQTTGYFSSEAATTIVFEPSSSSTATLASSSNNTNHSNLNSSSTFSHADSVRIL